MSAGQDMTEGVLSLGSRSLGMNLCPQIHPVPALSALSPGEAPGARCRRAEDGGGRGSGRRGRAGGAAAIGGTRLPPGGNKRLATARPHRHTFTALLLSSQGDQGMRECGFLRFIPNPVCVHPVTGLLQTTDQTSE